MAYEYGYEGRREGREREEKEQRGESRGVKGRPYLFQRVEGSVDAISEAEEGTNRSSLLWSINS